MGRVRMVTVYYNGKYYEYKCRYCGENNIFSDWVFKGKGLVSCIHCMKIMKVQTIHEVRM